MTIPERRASQPGHVRRLLGSPLSAVPRNRRQARLAQPNFAGAQRVAGQASGQHSLCADRRRPRRLFIHGRREGRVCVVDAKSDGHHSDVPRQTPQEVTRVATCVMAMQPARPGENHCRHRRDRPLGGSAPQDQHNQLLAFTARIFTACLDRTLPLLKKKRL